MWVLFKEREKTDRDSCDAGSVLSVEWKVTREQAGSVKRVC